MFREKPTYPNVVEVKKSIFWKNCRFCNADFKKEKYYKINEIFSNGCVMSTYACNRCFGSVSEVTNKLTECKKLRPPRR